MDDAVHRDLEKYLSEVDANEDRYDMLLINLKDELYEDLDYEIFEMKRKYHDKYPKLNDWEINDLIKEVFDELF